MDLGTFQSLPTEEVARLVREAGPKVCAFPTKGSRRWFMLEYPDQAATGMEAYSRIAARRHVELFKMLFDHGIDTLVMPMFGPNELKRGEGYMRTIGEGLAWLATHLTFTDFYKAYQVRVRFYGDYRKCLEPTPYAYLSDLFDKATAQTLAHERHRLFYGVFAHDAAETVAELAVRYYNERGYAPDKRAMVEAYYGEYIEPVGLFIGCGKLRVFDVPLVMTDRTDLYFTVSPSLYFTQQQLRAILYDHLYARIRTKVDLQPGDWALMGDFYRANVGRTLGVGARQRDLVWYPLPQVELPAGFAE
jgi:tuberculosinol/isotuberculosinol synthase